MADDSHLAHEKTRLLLQSLVTGPVLLGQLPEAARFQLERLYMPEVFPTLNFRQKLGHIYEDALGILLSASTQFDLVYQSLQIQRDKHTTVGELDYLIRDSSSGSLIHLELATKFYLAVQTECDLQLPGPDARDNYYLKLARLREHQLKLPELYHEHLPEDLRREKPSPRHLVYGCLFDHIGSSSKATPELIASDCRRGMWLHHKDLHTHFPKSTRFELIPKVLWPVPLTLFTKLKLAAWDPGEPVDYCVMIRIPGDGTPYFIAPNGYPNHGAGMR